jgi:3-hydroxyisobutyrate dehydrogenase
VQIGFIGLGAMGAPMAANLAERFDTLVWNRTASVAHDHASACASRAVDELRELGGVELVASCLPTDVEVTAVAEVLGPALRPGTVWVDHTSGAPGGSRDVAALLAGRGVDYLDAPVSGGVAGAQAGTLTVMLGGDESVVARVTPVLDAVAARVVHVGPVGAGMAVKAVNNALLATSLQAAAEGLVALERAGVSASRALEVVNAATGRSFATEVLIPERVLTRAFPNTFALSLLAKDVGLAEGVLAEQGVPEGILAAVAGLVASASEQLGADADHVELVRIVEAAVGVELR